MPPKVWNPATSKWFDPPEFEGWEAVGIDVAMMNCDVLVEAWCLPLGFDINQCQTINKHCIGVTATKKYGFNDKCGYTIYRPKDISYQWQIVKASTPLISGDLLLRGIIPPKELVPFEQVDSALGYFIPNEWIGECATFAISEDEQFYHMFKGERKVFRRVGFQKIRLKLNKAFSQPLPLP